MSYCVIHRHCIFCHYNFYFSLRSYAPVLGRLIVSRSCYHRTTLFRTWHQEFLFFPAFTLHICHFLWTSFIFISFSLSFYFYFSLLSFYFLLTFSFSLSFLFLHVLLSLFHLFALLISSLFSYLFPSHLILLFFPSFSFSSLAVK